MIAESVETFIGSNLHEFTMRTSRQHEMVIIRRMCIHYHTNSIEEDEGA